MTPADQLAHFSGSTDNLAMSGLWYSHKRVTELVQAARKQAVAECRDQDNTEAEKVLAEVREWAEAGLEFDSDANCMWVALKRIANTLEKGR